LLVAEVGDELEGAAEGGDEPVEDVLGGDGGWPRCASAATGASKGILEYLYIW
jgi:hypothetical protein